jgi:hypothetical protein
VQNVTGDISLKRPGFVVARMTRNERVRVIIPRSDKKCFMCDASLWGKKCLIHEKGTMLLFYECLNCYRDSLEK